MAKIDVKEVAIRVRSKRTPNILDVMAITQDGKEISLPYRIECWADVLMW